MKEFVCPVMKCQLNLPCQLQECKFWINVDWTRNCLLSYAATQGVSNLTVEEVSFLYDFPLKKVIELSNSALKKMHDGVVHAESYNSPELERQFWFIPTKKVCCVCSSSIPDDDGNRIDIADLGLAYCSQDCADEKHRLLVKLEYQNGLPIQNILSWAFHRFRSVAGIERAMGLPRWLIEESCERFLGRKVD